MRWLMNLWAKVVYWWTMKPCTECGTILHKDARIESWYFGLYSHVCVDCHNKACDAAKKIEHEEMVEKEMKILKAKEEARVRFEVERAGSYRSAPAKIRVKDEGCSTCGGLKNMIDVCMDCRFEAEQHELVERMLLDPVTGKLEYHTK